MTEKEIQMRTEGFHDDGPQCAPAPPLTMNEIWDIVSDMRKHDLSPNGFIQREMKRIEKQVKAGDYEKLWDLQACYATLHRCPLFCFKTTSVGNPIGAYMVTTYGLEKAIKAMRDELITGCPETSRTWCD